MIAPEIETVCAAFESTAKRHPERAFLNVLPETAALYGIAAGEVTYAEAAREVAALREKIAGAGYLPGQRVMLLMENRPAFFLWWLALNGLGLSVVPVNPCFLYTFDAADELLCVVLVGRLYSQKITHYLYPHTPDTCNHSFAQSCLIKTTDNIT